ncbi:MAG: radical SAM protein [Clostridiales bacterium]|nr:radical SAM protein [Clostridiales bacterium]MDD7034923.1 radical SAM protein [Bacillota bacterium]MDY2920316.1 radical SAM protein [Lentihominibacter sp.]
MNIISRTRSICPVCRRPVEAYYMQEDGCCDMGTRVFFVQNCPEHGEFRTLAAERADDFKAWIRNPVMNIPPEKAITKGDPEDASCPLHCGTCENHLQTTCCVLIDVTARCNQHCPYCFALSGDAVDPAEPTLEEISAKYDWLLEQGEEGREFNIQLSGGEPTVRDDLPEIIRMARDKGFSYVQINSNGRRLAEEEGYAQKLKDAGASVIFMQFDGTRDDIYMQLRGEPLFEKKVQAIRNCEKAGLAVTLVPTVVKGVNDDNIGEMMDFLVENVNVVKGIHFQPASFFGRYPEGDETEGRITMFGLLRELEEQRPAFRYTDSLPISTGHTLCCFYSTYIREPDGSIRCTITAKQQEEGISCCDTQAPGECCCCGEPEMPESGVVTTSCCDMTTADRLEVIKKDRDYVLNKWDVTMPEESCCGETQYESAEDITDLDEFLAYYRRNTFTVTGMAFQDERNLDSERLKRCRVVQLTEDNRLIPFCAYNTIYREQFQQKRKER